MLDFLRRLIHLPRRRLGLLLLGALVAFAFALLVLRGVAGYAIAGGLRQAAAKRGAQLAWGSLDLTGPMTVRIRDLSLTRVHRGDGFSAESLSVTIDPWALLLFSVRPSRLDLRHARITIARRAATAESLEAEPGATPRAATAEQVRQAAETLARLALAPARSFPHLRLRDIALVTAPSEESALSGARIEWLDITHPGGGARIAGRGEITLEQLIPFELALEYGTDDRLTGRLWFGVSDSTRETLDSLVVRVDGAVTQDRRRGEVLLADETRLWIGEIPFKIGGRMVRRGPQVDLWLSADGITQRQVEASIPAPLLGPLTDLSVEGSFDYRLKLDLDLDHPDQVDFAAAVAPHGLAIEGQGTRLRLLGLDQPFTAEIHLPRGRTAARDLSESNPFYRPLESIDSILVYAVVTNEDGGFFKHRGFNVDAMKRAIIENLRAGAYRQGAGTITMQVARNLYLGHQRTLSRKAQEVVLAWMLEHLTGLSKQRLLEIYLNIVEWGPGVHGAAEAAHYYFGADAGHLTHAQALFLSTLLPSPTKWRWRLGKEGDLRPSTRQQMHFIGRAMVAKGWLDPAELPPTDSLEVRISGPARALLSPERAPLAAPADSARATRS